VTVSSTTYDLILEAAAALFAERGFHGVTTREIAAGAGVNVAAIHYHGGSKRELYLTVIRRLYEAERELVARFAEEMDEETVRNPEALGGLLGRFAEDLVDLLAEHPERARLYVNRWLEEADELSGTEAELSLALHGPWRDLLDRAQLAGTISRELNPSLFLRSFSWLVFGYFVSGPIDWETWRGDPHVPENLAAFKAYLRRYLRLMLGLEGVPRDER
jgi:AcrR family transcriptional regulator